MNDEEFERCWAVTFLKFSSLGMFQNKDPDVYKQMFKDNWDACGGLEWFNKLQERRHE